MKTEREIAEQIFQLFRNSNCKSNQGFMINVLNNQVVWKLNPKEQEIFNIVYIGLQALQYISVDNDGHFIRLTQKGFDYIYDDELVAKMQAVPWVIPEYENTNWNSAYNKLWRTIGPQNVPYYIGGPKFLEFVSDLCDDVSCSYSNYIGERQNKGLSTSRVDYYQDLINHLDEEKRFELYVNIQNYWESQVLSATNNDSLSILDDSFANFEQPTIIQEEKPEEHHPKVFISYSWDSEEHKKWVLDLATKLCENGIDVILDQWEISNRGGSPIPNFMINSVSSSERVLCIMTPNYKLKTDKLEGGVGFEYSILSSEIAEDLKTTKFIPILRNGDEQQSTPILLKKRIGYFMRDEDDFDTVFNDLLRDLYNEPKIVKPTLGKKPKFD